MKKLRFISAVLLAVLFGTCAYAELQLSVQGPRGTFRYYARAEEEGRTTYWAHAVQVAESATENGVTVYRDPDKRPLGEARTVDGTIVFCDAAGKELAKLVRQETKDVYYSGGKEIGQAYRRDGRFVFTDAGGREIGQAGESDPHIRAIPVEVIVLAGAGVTASRDSDICLPVITEVAEEGAARTAGLQKYDIIIGYQGDKWTTFSFMGYDPGESASRVTPIIDGASERGDLVMIVYRPGLREGMSENEIAQLREKLRETRAAHKIAQTDDAFLEKESAHGMIFASAPMPEGKKGFSWTPKKTADGSMLSNKGMYLYYTQIVKIYSEWLASGNSGPAVRVPSCLPRVTDVAPEGQALAAGMQVGDFLIGLLGEKKSFFEHAGIFSGSTYTSVAHELDVNENDTNAPLVVYRPASGEKNTAKGQILKLSPMKKGRKGFYFDVSDECQFYSREESSVYVAQIQALYEKWVAEGNNVFVHGPAALTRFTYVPKNSAAYAAGLREGDFLIGYMGEAATAIEYAKLSSSSDSRKKVRALIESMSSKPDAVMIVYRPASDETGEARGKIIRLDPMSAGDKGVKYATVSECTFYAHSQGAVYAQQIQALYEKWLAENNGGPAVRNEVPKSRPKGSASLTVIWNIDKEGTAYAAGLRRDDFLIGYEGEPVTALGYAKLSGAEPQKKVKAWNESMRDKPDTVMIVYRPEPGEKGEAKGKIIRLDPMPAGDKGFKYRTGSSSTFYSRDQGAAYAADIQALYDAWKSK